MVGSFDLTDKIMNWVGQGWYRYEKAQVLAATFEFRTQLAAAYQRKHAPAERVSPRYPRPELSKSPNYPLAIGSTAARKYSSLDYLPSFFSLAS